MDETDTEPAPKKRKLTKAAEAKLKAQEKAKAKKGKKKGDDDGDYEDGESDEDAYTALPKMWKDQNKPPVGSFEDCAKCSKQFTAVSLPPSPVAIMHNAKIRPNIPWLPNPLLASYVTHVRRSLGPTLSKNPLLPVNASSLLRSEL